MSENTTTFHACTVDETAGGAETTGAVKRAAEAWREHHPQLRDLDAVPVRVAPHCAGCDFTLPDSDGGDAMTQPQRWHQAFVLHRQQAALAAALDVDEIAGALLPATENWWCGDHVDYHETDDWGGPQPCCIAAREEKAREGAVAVVVHLLGSAA